MKSLTISASDKQLSKLRNGHRVRIMPAIAGEGVNLIVDPARYDQITKTFAKGKGTTISLTPEELSANKGVEGMGIFSKVKKGLKKVGKALSSKEAMKVYGETAKIAAPILIKAAVASATRSPAAAAATPTPTAGSGLYLRGSGVCGRGSLLNVSNSHLPPALQSQNASANFHFHTQMPAKLQMIEESGGAETYSAPAVKHLRGRGLYL